METAYSLQRHCYDNVCHCDWRLTLYGCVESNAVRIINIINITVSALASLIGIYKENPQNNQVCCKPHIIKKLKHLAFRHWSSFLPSYYQGPLIHGYEFKKRLFKTQAN